MQITITSVNFTSTPGSNQDATIEYKLSTDSVYIVLDSAAVIQPDGTLVSPVSFSVEEGSCYDMRVTTDCGVFVEQQCIDSETTTTTSTSTTITTTVTTTSTTSTTTAAPTTTTTTTAGGSTTTTTTAIPTTTTTTTAGSTTTTTTVCARPIGLTTSIFAGGWNQDATIHSFVFTNAANACAELADFKNKAWLDEEDPLRADSVSFGYGQYTTLEIGQTVYLGISSNCDMLSGVYWFNPSSSPGGAFNYYRDTETVAIVTLVSGVITAIDYCSPGVTTTTTSTTTTTTLPLATTTTTTVNEGGDITLQNLTSIGGNTINSISPSGWTSFDSGQFPVGPSSSESSFHTAYFGPLTVTATVTLDSRIEIYVNGGLYQCHGEIGTGTMNYVFSSVSFLNGDLVEIKLTSGDNCP